MSDKRKDSQRAADKFSEILLDAIKSGREGDYLMCATIVEAFRHNKGDEAAAKVRRVLWEMVQEQKV